MAKTNAEKCREYRQRKKGKKVKTDAKSSTERVREFRARRKPLLNVQSPPYVKYISNAHNNAPTLENGENDHRVKSELPFLSVKQETSDHEEQYSDISAPDEPLVSVKSEDLYLGKMREDLFYQEEAGLSHIKDEIEIGPTVIQASVATKVEASGISGGEFLANYSLNVETDHSGDKLFSCGICNYNTDNISLLSSHVHNHSKKTFSCNMCNYKTDRKCDLTNHMYICRYMHSVHEKPFSCHMCNYKSNNKHLLTKHFHSHTGDKLHYCYLCVYRTNKKSELKEHIRTHTEDKPYSC